MGKASMTDAEPPENDSNPDRFGRTKNPENTSSWVAANSCSFHFLIRFGETLKLDAIGGG